MQGQVSNKMKQNFFLFNNTQRGQTQSGVDVRLCQKCTVKPFGLSFTSVSQ